MLFPLCVCFEIVLITPSDKSFSSNRFHRQASDIPFLNTNLVRSFPIVFAKFRHFCRLLERTKTDDANPETLVVRCVPFAYALCASVCETGPLLTYLLIYLLTYLLTYSEPFLIIWLRNSNLHTERRCSKYQYWEQLDDCLCLCRTSSFS